MENAQTGDKITKTDKEWHESLAPEQCRVLRQKGTERAFTGMLYNIQDRGTYRCAACGNPLFSSETKYDSGSGWPSFWAPILDTAVDSAWSRSLIQAFMSP